MSTALVTSVSAYGAVGLSLERDGKSAGHFGRYANFDTSHH